MIIKFFVTLFALTILITYFNFLKWININVLNLESFTIIQFFLAVIVFTLFLYYTFKISQNKKSNYENNDTKETIIFVFVFIFSTLVLPYSLKLINKNLSLQIIETKEYTIVKKQILPIRFNSVNYLFIKDKEGKVFSFSSSNNSKYTLGNKIILNTKKGFLGFDYLEEKK